jgi:hypothetical protein
MQTTTLQGETIMTNVICEMSAARIAELTKAGAGSGLRPPWLPFR